MRRCDPCRLSLVSLAVTLAALPAFADWKLSDYRTLAADSAKVNQFYGIQSYSNRGSNTALSVGRDSTGSFLRFNASQIASDGIEGYTANVGVLHPLTPDWASYDLRALTGIQFEYRNSAPITDHLMVSIGSEAYTSQMWAGQTTYQCNVTVKAALAAHSSWVTATLDILDFAPPKWWTPTADFPAISQVLEKAKSIEFAPKTLYSGDGTQNGVACTKCVGPTMPKQILDIRNVVLIDASEQPWPPADTIIDTTIILPPPPPPPSGYLLSSYAKQTLDSASTAKTYGIVSVANPASQATAMVPGGFVRLEAPVIASELASAPNGNGYSANVSLIHPLRADWREANLRKLTGIRFQFRNFAKITDALNVSFGSSVYSAELEKAGTLYENPVTGSARLAADTNWKSIDLDILDFTTPRWWTPPPEFPMLDSVLSRVRSISFTPQTLYSAEGISYGKPCTKCVGPTMAKQRLDIRDVRLLGIDSLELVPLVVPPPPPSSNDSCRGSNVVRLDTFQEGGLGSSLGGWWYSYSDTGSEIPSQMMHTKGSSRSFITVQSGKAKVEAYLDKILNEHWVPQAGWAGVATDIHGGFNLKGLKAVQFDLGIDTIYPSVGLLLKVHEAGSPAEASFAAPIQAKSGLACVTTGSLAVVDSTGKTRLLDASRIDRFSFEARILDEVHPFVNTAQAHFTLRDVKLFGVDPTEVSKVRARLAQGAFSVSFQNGALSMSGIDGLGEVVLRDLRGRTVASFAAASRVPLQLSNGTYLLSAKRGALPLTRSFAVMGR